MSAEGAENEVSREEMIATLQRAVRLGRMDRTMAAYALKSCFPELPVRSAESIMACSESDDRDGLVR